MEIAVAVFRDARQPQQTLHLQWLQPSPIEVVEFVPPSCDLVHLLQLAVQERTGNLARDIRRSDVNPRVFIHMTAEELPAVRSLVTNDFSAFQQAGIIHTESPALAAADVLCLVKAVSTKVTQRAQCPAVVKGIHSLSGILDNSDPVMTGQLSAGGPFRR